MFILTSSIFGNANNGGVMENGVTAVYGVVVAVIR